MKSCHAVIGWLDMYFGSEHPRPQQGSTFLRGSTFLHLETAPRVFYAGARAHVCWVILQPAALAPPCARRALSLALVGQLLTRSQRLWELFLSPVRFEQAGQPSRRATAGERAHADATARLTDVARRCVRRVLARGGHAANPRGASAVGRGLAAKLFARRSAVARGAASAVEAGAVPSRRLLIPWRINCAVAVRRGRRAYLYTVEVVVAYTMCLSEGQSHARMRMGIALASVTSVVSPTRSRARVLCRCHCEPGGRGVPAAPLVIDTLALP